MSVTSSLLSTATALLALAVVTPASAATLTYTFDAAFTGEYADPAATQFSGDPLSGKYTGLGLGQILAGSVSVDYADAKDLAGNFAGSGKVTLGKQTVAGEWFEFYSFASPDTANFQVADMFGDEVFNFDFQGSGGKLTYVGMLDFYDDPALSTYWAHFALSNVRISGAPEIGKSPQLAAIPLPATLPLVGIAMLALGLCRRRKTA